MNSDNRVVECLRRPGDEMVKNLVIHGSEERVNAKQEGKHIYIYPTHM